MADEDATRGPLLCPNGHEVQAGVRFCPECGAAISAAEGAAIPASPEGTATPAPGKPRNMIPWLAAGAVVVAAVVAAVLLVGGGQTITGEFALFDSELGSDCQGSGGYSDIGPGASVTVRNEKGETIGTSNLGSGEHISGFGCTYDFTVDGVPNAKFYRIEVSHRGEVEYSRAEIEAADWNVNLSLGDAGS
jgi:hypothetical protein